MADALLWVTACEGALGLADTVRAAYGRNRDNAIDTVLEDDPVAGGILTLMTSRSDWSGTATELLGVLRDGVVSNVVRRGTDWPSNARALSGRVRRVATFLRHRGIDIAFKKEGRKRLRMIYITAAGEVPTPPHAPSASSASGEKELQVSCLLVPRVQAHGGSADDCGHKALSSTGRENTRWDNGLDDADGAGADLRTPRDKQGSGA